MPIPVSSSYNKLSPPNPSHARKSIDTSSASGPGHKDWQGKLPRRSASTMARRRTYIECGPRSHNYDGLFFKGLSWRDEEWWNPRLRWMQLTSKISNESIGGSRRVSRDSTPPHRKILERTKNGFKKVGHKAKEYVRNGRRST